MKDESVTKKDIGFWLPIMVSAGSIIFTVAVNFTQVAQLKTDFEKHKEDQRIEELASQRSYTEIQVRLAEIQKDILFIKDNLEEHRTNE